MLRLLIPLVVLAHSVAAADDAILRFILTPDAVTATHWKGTPGQALKLPADALRLNDAISFTGRGSTPLASGLVSAESLGLPLTSLTATAVFSVESAGEWGGVLGFFTDNGGLEKGWVLGFHGNRFAFGLAARGSPDKDGSMTYLESATTWETGRLYHVAATYDGKTMRLFVNGREDATSTKQHGEIFYPDRSALAVCGYRDSNENYPLAGRVASVELLDRARSPDEIAADFAPWKSATDKAPILSLALPHPIRPSAIETAGPRSERDVLLPISQRITPAGRQLVLPKKRPQGIAMHPGGNYAVAAGGGEVLVLDPENAAILSRVAMPASNLHTEPPADHILIKDEKAQFSFHGLAFSPAGDRLYLSNVGGDIKVFTCDATGGLRPSFSIALPKVKGLERSHEIPAGLCVSADGKRLYAALNLSDRLAEIDTADGKLLRTIPVGVAPYDIALANGKAYVSCWGGRTPGTNDLIGPAGRGTKVRVDPVHFAAAEGSVAVVDLAAGTVNKHFLTGLHASGLALHPKGRLLCVANANSDSVSTIDTKTDEVVSTTRLDWQPLGYFGASPNALCFSADGDTLYVCNGTQNAVAVLDFDERNSKLAGLIPVGWYPGAITFDKKHTQLLVANIKGIGSGSVAMLAGKDSFNSHDHNGSLSFVSVAKRKELAAWTQQVLTNCRRETMEAATLAARPGRAAQPVPERAGEPSPIHHVIYVIKENRTYDQVLSDLPQGNGDPFLCIFGEDVTPNLHKIAREFVLLDNFYCCGVLSADGHQWATSGFVTDYMEKQFAGWPRSYPDFCGADEHDALAYSPKGFLWDAVLAKGGTVRNYGESSSYNRASWRDTTRKGKPAWRDHVANCEAGTEDILYETDAGIDSLKGRTCTNTVGWNTGIPDVIRMRRFVEELRAFEKSGDLPTLCVLALPNDHTAGTKEGGPTPAAMVADNDLAVGRLVDAVSHSRFWSNTVIFITEDDPQAGWDHVSAYRTTGYVISPYTKRSAVVSEAYSQNSMLRTIGLMLGTPPMNQLDAIAPPMAACFTDQPNFTPFTAVSNRVPLTQLNGQTAQLDDWQLRRDAVASANLPLQVPDACPEDLLNRILWRAQRGPIDPYPEWALLPESERGDDDDE